MQRLADRLPLGPEHKGDPLRPGGVGDLRAGARAAMRLCIEGRVAAVRRAGEPLPLRSAAGRRPPHLTSAMAFSTLPPSAGWQ